MFPLPSELRKDLEKAVIAARDAAERGAESALRVLAVDQPEPFDAMTPQQRQLRNALRARARALGGSVRNGLDSLLVEEVAYEHWHRMLFARFLADNELLVHPEYGVAVTLEECRELAEEEGEPDEWMVAARYAGAMLPGIFRKDDPAVQVRFAPNDLHVLESILNGLSTPVFTADDSLGWVYQFWQTKAKEEVNASGRKIGGRDLAPVTQLFTENYMVRFLLENSLGAWWAAWHPDSPLIKEWEYLRFRDDGTPAAGTFPGWPERAAEVTVMDPCCGSGHFLVVAFEMLRRMRMEEEGLGAVESSDAVIRDNLFGLEIDPRCTQLAAFALAFAAWKRDGYRPIPIPNIACSGLAVKGQIEEWTKLAGDDVNLRLTLERLYHLFADAPDLGSLINPADAPLSERMFAADYGKVAPLLHQALSREGDDPVSAVFGAVAEGVARAGALLALQYTLVATNVPYLGRGLQVDSLKSFLTVQHPESKPDLATAFVDRCRAFSCNSGSYAVVSPQAWLFLKTYHKFRMKILRKQATEHITRLGPGAFEMIGGHVVNVTLSILTNRFPREGQEMTCLDVSPGDTPASKSMSLRNKPLLVISQAVQMGNPDSRILLTKLGTGPVLRAFAQTYEGLHSGDYLRFGRKFWEIDKVGGKWSLQQAGPAVTSSYAGREHVMLWENGQGELIDYVQERLGSQVVTMWIKGEEAWGKAGVAVSVMGSLKATIYTGQIFTHGVVAIIPRFPEHLPAVWAYCQSEDFRVAARTLDQKLAIARSVFDHIPFDLEYWAEISREAGTLLSPDSPDPNQWVFKGNPAGSMAPLQVAVARLLGYCWPEQKMDALDSLADSDGIACIPPVSGVQPAAERLRSLLAAAYANGWSLSLQGRLLSEAGSPGKSLEQWLRDDFFAQHCKLFHNRPFIWHVWDGRRDGFSALVNYHRLDKSLLEKLTYTYLGWWIGVQRSSRDQGQAGADGRLTAAQGLQKKIELILEGEPPHDIYVRWKPLHSQPIGWDLDLDDGVRLNIRPFVKAGVLRRKFTINWKKDRGMNPDGSERHNDCRYTIEQKMEARKVAGL